MGRAEDLADAVRKRLDVVVDEQAAFADDDAAFRRWRDAVELSGVLVVQFERVDPEEVRGFSLLGDPPAIAINLHDRPVTAKTFTLFHEFAHILHGQAAICIPELARAGGENDPEVSCNAFAAELLVPRRAFLSSPPVVRLQRGEDQDIEETVAEVRKIFRVGRFVILRRLLTFDLIAVASYRRIASRWMKEVPPPKAGGGGAGAYQRKILNELGRPLVRRVLRAHEIGAVSVPEVVELLAVKRRHLETLRDLAFR